MIPYSPDEDELELARVQLKFSKNQVDAAGKAIIQKELSSDCYEHALEVISNWRATHNLPLVSIRKVLTMRAKRIDPNALVVHRIKRLPAIKLKLEIMKELKLSRMQDIGGCRVILKSSKDVNKLFLGFIESPLSHHLHNFDDYIMDKPKSSGYRGIHLIYRFHSDTYQEYQNLRIEMQLRSIIQHAWATAVEIVDTFTQQALKSNIGKADWKRFFQLMGGALALTEGTTPVPNTPTEWDTLVKESREYAIKLDVMNALMAFGQVATSFAERIIQPNKYY